MTPATLAPKPRPVPPAGLALWYAVPVPVRLALRARAPLDSRQHGTGAEILLVSVGCGVPLRWLEVAAGADGAITCRLWEVRQKTKEIGTGTTTADQLPAFLQRWAREFNLSAG